MWTAKAVGLDGYGEKGLHVAARLAVAGGCVRFIGLRFVQDAGQHV